MRVKKVRLKDFKRFSDLAIQLGDDPKKIVALVGPNGSGKSSVFDGFDLFATRKQEEIRGMMMRKNVRYYLKKFYQIAGFKAEDEHQLDENAVITSDQDTYLPTSFYIRSAYRFTPRLEVSRIEKLEAVEEDHKKPRHLVDSDTRLEENYERLVGCFFSDVYGKDLTGQKWEEDNIGNLNKSLCNILDIKVASLGNPTTGEGSLYFTKGNSIKFPYENLSAGEKEVIDLILDLLVKRDIYTNSVICIDEPELHINTAIQRKLLIEMEKIVPDSCQLWIATHSIGFLRALQDDLSEKTQVIDFGNYDFDQTVTLKPIKGSRKDWQRIFETALEDLTGLLAPKKIIYCEGRPDPDNNGGEQGLDATIYNEIFFKHGDTLFVSSGGGGEIKKNSLLALKVLKKAFGTVELILLKDRDDLTDHERNQFINEDASHRMLTRHEIENYLFDKEIVKKFCQSRNVTFDETRYDSKVTDVMLQDLKPVQDDIKASCNFSEHITEFKKQLSHFITEDTTLYSELERCILN